MRYGEPSIAKVLDASRRRAPTASWSLPLYPQYAASTTASIGDAVAAWMRRTRNVPELRFVKHYHDDAGYIDALAARVVEHWRVNGRPDKLVLSFHGLPRRSLALGDPYHCECLKTGRLLAERLKLRDGMVVVTFQSRFGKAEWLQPYTEPTLVELARAGRRPRRRVVPGLHGRLPGDARGDRPGSARRVPGGRRQAIRLHPVPERPARMDRRPGRRRAAPPAGLGRRRRGPGFADARTALERQRQRALAAGATR